MTSKLITREEWLMAAVVKLRELFAEIDVEIPDVRVSVGWPGGGGRGQAERIGECWVTEASNDAVAQLFVSPALDDPMQVLSTLTHELVHASDNCESGHRGVFRKRALAIGLEGRMTATVAGEGLLARLAAIEESLGAFPHAALSKGASGRKKQGTRMFKLVCPSCDYAVRTTRKWLDVGLPTCPCGTEMEES